MMEELLNSVKDVIYWTKFTPNQRSGIIEIIKDPEIANKGNAICEFLNIEKRGNRSAINNVLGNTPTP